ncbi:hypothetical protein M011DRAFT_518052 [Sporormia fimetaria CBS 119925]|uniref:Uncharacterized protein n=1 Tax=Sporormia fimetaria CBS 119925 TaxID=1340428 RepID=A0A6A6VI82_9PLEO|nr:hypothetical protein M011DRAFT_518052 [Sporormia fimetaria CBS 119925]
MAREAVKSPLTLLLVTACVDATKYDFDFLDNYRRPAPAPEDGPPASRNASRDKSLLPAQACAIAGAYILTVLIWGVLLLTVGRKMRRKAETTPKALELRLVTSRFSSRTPASPQSARSATSWFKRGFKNNPTIDSNTANAESPSVYSPAPFDQKVIDSDRERAQADMERLYAAVMEHDRKKSMSQYSNDGTGHNERRALHIDTNGISAHSNPASPVRAIFPPGYHHNGPPTAPLPHNRLRDERPSSPRSILSKRSIASDASRASKNARFNLKNLRIAHPAKYPDNGHDDEARTPLSPNFHDPNFHDPNSPRSVQTTSPTTPGDLDYEQLDEVQPLPRPAPQRLGSYNSTHAPSPRSATAHSNALPLRGYAEPLKSPDLRTTVLDRRRDELSMGSPQTGVPFTPYSPYMPFTPVTPVTPHLVTRRERKERRREEGRGARSGRDMVQSPKEIFGDAY